MGAYPDEPIVYGPLKKRSCTDIICLGIFGVFIACWVGIGIYAYTNGQPEVLLRPRDSYGSRCGYDHHVKNKTYLFYFDLTECLDSNVAFFGCDTPQICIEECPDETFLLDDVVGNNKLEEIICLDGITKPKTKVEAEALVENNQCARWHIKSKPESDRCIPDGDEADYEIFEKYEGLEDVTAENMNKSIKNVELLQKMNQMGKDLIEDLDKSWGSILGGIAIAIFTCILYIVMLRWVAFIMVWASIGAVLALFGVCVYLCADNYIYYRDNPLTPETTENIFEEFVNTPGFWLTILIIVSIILIILVIVVLFLRNRICLAIGLVGEGSKAVSATISALFFPVVPFLFHTVIIIIVVSITLFLSSIGHPYYEVRGFDGDKCDCPNGALKYGNNDKCDVESFKCDNLNGKTCEASCAFIEMINPGIIPYLHAYNIFGFFWGIFFISALGELILAGTFATWYWTFKKSNVPFFVLTQSTGRAFRYHIGTVAFGSLLVAICRMIRVVLEYIDHKCKKFENPFVKAILCCMKCFFWCLEKFLKFINRNAYILCAIYGKNFCSSARRAFTLIMSNPVRAAVLDKVVDFLFFISKVVVTIGVTCIVYTFINLIGTQDLTYDYFPLILVAISSYLVATVFFSVYTMAIDTLFICCLEDLEKNDGSKDKPYYMSKNMMSLMDKKNKYN